MDRPIAAQRLTKCNRISNSPDQMIGGEILFFHQRQRKGGLRHIQHLGVVIFRQNGADDLIELFLGVALHIYFSHALLVQRGDEDQLEDDDEGDLPF